jgi:hypothetical protein
VAPSGAADCVNCGNKLELLSFSEGERSRVFTALCGNLSDRGNAVIIAIILVLSILITVALDTVITRGDAAYLYGFVGCVRIALDERSGPWRTTTTAVGSLSTDALVIELFLPIVRALEVDGAQ